VPGSRAAFSTSRCRDAAASARHGDIRGVDGVDFQKLNEKEQGGHAFRVIAAYERWFEQEATKRTEKESILRCLCFLL